MYLYLLQEKKLVYSVFAADRLGVYPSLFEPGIKVKTHPERKLLVTDLFAPLPAVIQMKFFHQGEDFKKKICHNLTPWTSVRVRLRTHSVITVGVYLK